MYMENKLCGHIAQILYETAECGFIPDIRQVIYKEDNLPFYVMSSQNNRKAVLIGLMEDLDKEIFVKCFSVNYNKWNWASLEGFNLESIFRGDLYKEVFSEVEPSKVSSYFLK